uniref:RHS repeat protein n=1 Tax=Pedobacter schmidteae TaxID=2201271 RepID=UPI0013CEB732|nr:RHS repeat protein [Pedobacter schmidteae]
MKWTLIIKKRYKIILVVGILLVKVSLSFGQITPPIILPPSPQSHALISYNSPEVGLSTGTVQISIPLFKVEKKNFSLPINLKYSSNGLKVDEVASRTGQSWVLNAGGVIIRNVNGKPDEYATRKYPPNEGTALNKDMLNYLNEMATLTNVDGEPDEYIFNFNGYSGKFIIDSNGQPVVMPHSGLKIDFPSVLNPNITITAPDGVVYSFTDKEYSYTESYCYVNAPNPVVNPVVTSWYLTSITLPNFESINFAYDHCSFGYYIGISQSILKSDNYANAESASCANQCNANQTTYCASHITVSQGKRLSQIYYDNTTVDFIYQSRNDIPGDKLLNGIEIKESGSLINKYLFEYTYAVATTGNNMYLPWDETLKQRPFLISLREKGTSATEEKVHTFSYNDIQGLPQRLTFSQDHYGFYNGKNNFSFVASIEDDPYVHNIFGASATADRSVDSEYAKKGILTHITYPGGGSDTLIYESNTYATTEATPIPTSSTTLRGTSSATLPFVKTSSAFQINYDHPSMVSVFAGMLIPGGGGTSIDPNLDLMEVQIVKASDNSVVFSRMLKLGQQVTENITGLSLNTDYYLRMEILYDGIPGTFYINYPVGNPGEIPVNKPLGGLRLSRLVTNPGNGQAPLIKKYHYASLSDLSKSSGVKFQDPVYLRSANSLLNPCTIAFSYFICKNLILASHSQKSIYSYGQSSVQYSAVTESLGGDNFENGGIEHLFTVDKDRFSVGLVGDLLRLGDKYSNTGYLNGLEKETNFFKYDQRGFTKIKQVNNHYSVSNAISKTVPAYVIDKHYGFHLEYPQPTSEEFGGYEMYKYTHNSRWVVLDSTVTREFPDSVGAIKSKVLYTYNNSQHLQPNVINSITSRNKNKSIVKSYPAEMIAMGKDPNGVYSQMIAANILTPVVEEAIYEDSQLVSLTRTNYSNFFSGLFLPGAVESRDIIKGVDETRLRYHLYNGRGNPISLSSENGTKINYLWAYRGQSPIAEIKNADYSSIESIKGASAIDAFSLSYPDKAAIDAFVADLKVGLPHAEISTYSYKPLVGVTSQTDAKGMTTYYEYDSFQRLKHIKDQDGNIIKSYNYHYKP